MRFPTLRRPQPTDADEDRPDPELARSWRSRWIRPGDDLDEARAELVARLRRGEAVTDLRGADLRGADLSSLDLTRHDLRGADLSRADLTDAILLGADLRDAILFEACLDGTELSGARLERANLDRAHGRRTGLGCARLDGARLTGASLPEATLTQARLVGANLAAAGLPDARAREADLRGADLTSADLTGLELDLSNVSGATFDRANLQRADLKQLDGYKLASWISADVRDVDFAGAYLLRRFVMDQNFLEEFKAQSRWSLYAYRIWWLTSDCGRSLLRWAACTFVIAVVFALAYGSADLDYGPHVSWYTPFYFSVVILTTLGFGEIVPASTFTQVLATIQVVIGYVMLGGLISIMDNKIARRAE